MPAVNINGRTLDWNPSFDHRNWNYHISNYEGYQAAIVPSRYDLLLDARIKKLEAAVFPPAPTPTPAPPAPVSTSVVWNVPVVLDQGQDGECVGHGFAHNAAAEPKSNPVVGNQILENPTAEALYESAQRFDGSVPDEQSGASTLAGAKAAQAAGLVTSYHWCTSITEIATTVLTLGPVVIGIPWTNAMFNPDANGVIHATGSPVGGHCLLVNGYDSATKMFRLHNSWGASWGNNGEALISAVDLGRLFAQQGDACYAVKP